MDGDVPPDLAVRSHFHQFADSGQIHKIKTRAVALPAWQLATEYVHRVAESLADIGLVCAVIEDGQDDDESDAGKTEVMAGQAPPPSTPVSWCAARSCSRSWATAPPSTAAQALPTLRPTGAGAEGVGAVPVVPPPTGVNSECRPYG